MKFALPKVHRDDVSEERAVFPLVVEAQMRKVNYLSRGILATAFYF